MDTKGLRLLNSADTAELVKAPLAFVMFSTGVERFFHEHKPPDFPRVSTRGHFDTACLRSTPVKPDGYVGAFLGLSKERYVEDGQDATDYDVKGDTSGTGLGDDDTSLDEILVFVHGWLADEEAALGRMSLVRHSLETNGYPYPVVGYTWDAAQTVTEWRTGKTLGLWNGPKLARFVVEYKERHPETRLRLVSNSLGAHAFFSALEVLNAQGYENVVESATVLGGSVKRSSVGRGGEYYEAVENVAKNVYNYWSPHDSTLLRYYPLVEFEDAVGGGGPEDSPSNFHDRGVMYVPDHFSYLLTTRGCMHDVIADFGLGDAVRPDETPVTDEYEAFEDSGRVEVPPSGEPP